MVFFHMMPLLRGKPALILDNEKLFCGIKNKTIYWYEIERINPSPYGIFPIKLILKNGKKVRMHESEIRGGEQQIYKDILAYFEKSKTQPESL